MRRPNLILLPLLALPSVTIHAVEPAPASEDHEGAVVELSPLSVTGTAAPAVGVVAPAAVTSYEGAFVSENRIDSIAGLAPYVPGFFSSEQSASNPSYSIRGITTDNVDPRSEERVALFQDGVPISRTMGATVAMFDVDHVDVVKGPEPTRFVRGAQAGAVSIVSNPARNERSASLALTLGEYDTRAVEAVVNTPIIEDKLFARVSVFASENGGYVDNLVAGAPDLQDAQTAALRASLRWLPSDRTSLDVVFNFQRDTPGGTPFKSMVIPTSTGDLNAFSATELNRGGALGVDRDIESLAATLRTELSPNWSLTSTTTGRRFNTKEEYDGDGSRFYLFELGTRQKAEQLSQDIRFHYDSGERLTAMVGGSAFWEKGRQHVIIRTDERRAWALLAGHFRQGLIDAGVPDALANAAVPVTNPFVPDSALPTTLPLEFAAFNNVALPPELQALAALAGAPLSSRHQEGYYTDNEYRSLDLFSEVDFKVTERLTVGAGVRVTAESIESGYNNPDSGTGSFGFVLAGGSTNDVHRPTNGRLSHSDDNVGWSGRVHARYEITKAHEAFAAVTRGRRPPALSHDQITLDPIRLDEETVVNYEAGVRGALSSGRAIYSVSVFQYYYDGFQTNVATAPGVITAVDGGRARGQGVDATVRGVVNYHLSLFGSYGFTDAKFAALDEDGRPQAYAGNTFRLASRHTISLGGTASAPAFDHGTVYLSPVWQYKSEAYFEDDNARSGGQLRQGSYAIVNLTLGYRPTRGNWDAAIFAHNLFDRDYLLDAGNMGATFGLPTAVRGAPRVIGSRFSARF